MRKGHKTHNIFITASLIGFAFVCFAAACLLQSEIERVVDIPFYAEIGLEDSKVKICPWHNGTEGQYYFFLPAGCQTVQLRCENNTCISIESLNLNEVVLLSEIAMEKDYSGSVRDEQGMEQPITIIFMKSDTIPSLFISTESGSMDYINTQKGNAENGSYQIISEKGAILIEGQLLSLAGRGNTSWTECEKRGYKFTLNNAESLLGLKPSSEWVLIANARSNYLSNSIAFWLEKEIGISYYTNAEFIDLYFNGEYSGNYLLCEKIAVGDQAIQLQGSDAINNAANPSESVKKRGKYVDASERYKAFLSKNDPEDISCGFLIERDVPEYYEEEDCGIKLTTGDHYVIHWPIKATVAEAEYLWKYMEELHQAVASPDGYSNSGHYYTEYLDSESFALKYILEEFLAFNDAGRSSAYYYMNFGDPLKAGPGWDFEGAFLGNSQYLTMLNGTFYSTALFEQLMKHDDFKQVVIELYQTRLQPVVQKLQNQKLYELRDRIKASVDMDQIRWNREDFFESCNDILEWISQRIQFLDQHWSNEEEWVCLKFVNGWANNQYLYLRPGESISESMVEQLSDSQIIEWTNNEKKPIKYNVPLYEDVTIYGSSSSINRSISEILIGYAKQLLPELLFGVVFVFVSVIFFTQTKKGGC